MEDFKRFLKIVAWMLVLIPIGIALGIGFAYLAVYHGWIALIVLFLGVAILITDTTRPK